MLLVENLVFGSVVDKNAKLNIIIKIDIFFIFNLPVI